MTETKVGELLERATAELRPSTDLVAGGIADGRRRRRHGVAMTAAGAFAAAAVGVAGAALMAGGPGTGSTVVTDPSSSSGASSYAAQPSATSSAPADPVGDGPFPVGPDAMAATLEGLLDGTTSHPTNDQYHLSTPAGWQSGGVDYLGGSVSVSLQHSSGPRCDGDLARGNVGCTDLGGGFFLSTYSGELMTVDEGPTGVRNIGVTYYTPDGYKISVTAGNAGSADPKHPSVDEPVLGLDTLTVIAQDPVWQGR